MCAGREQQEEEDLNFNGFSFQNILTSDFSWNVMQEWLVEVAGGGGGHSTQAKSVSQATQVTRCTQFMRHTHVIHSGDKLR